MPKIRSNPTAHLLPGGLSNVDSQQLITMQAAAKWGVSPQTLWGIYGTESSFGANTGNSGSGPAGGAKGPMQFEDGTWQKYGAPANVQDFFAAMPAAAHYLHDLGADGNPTSNGTVSAVNAYNGNGGGTSQTTSYFQSVLKLGSQLAVSGTNATTTASTAAVGSGGGSGSSGGNASLLDVLNEIVTGNISDLASTLALAAAEGVKDLAVGFADLVIIPLWHRNQQAVYYYATNVLLPGKGNAKFSIVKTWPANAAFWGFGYGLLFTDPETGTLTPASPRKSRIARHVRRVQSVPARQTLIKPGKVKEKTPPKPKEVESRVNVTHVGTLSTTRNRPVRVTGSVYDRDRNSIKQPSTVSGESVRETGEGKVTPGGIQIRQSAPKSHTGNQSRQRPPARSRNRA